MRHIALALLLLIAFAPLRAQTVFLEAESCKDHNWEGPATFPGIVSGDRILRLWNGNDPPAAGYFARFPFTLTRASKQNVWAAVSLPSATSPFWWRIDDGAWRHFTDDSVIAQQDPIVPFGVSNVMAWVRLGSLPLGAGTHTLTLRVNERRSSLERAYLLYLDAILITPDDIAPAGMLTPITADRVAARRRWPVVERAGKPGPPMVLGTSVMGASENKLVRSLGFTLSQTDSEHLNVNQPAPGRWDWSSADAGLAACRKAGLAWQYFPHFHWPPKWYRETARFVPSVGLRSNKRLPCMSLWSPDILQWFDSCYAAMAEHYGSSDRNVKAIYLGIHGDFGEATFPAGYHPDEPRLFGAAGTGEPDFWCGDDSARADFRHFALGKHQTLAVLNDAWGVRWTSESAIDYPPAAYGAKVDLTATAQSRRRWLDFMDWYYGSMTRFTGAVAGIARKHFPKSWLVVPLGNGDENVLWGQDNTAIPRALRASHAHVRSTHGGFQPFAANVSTMLKRLATAAKFYHLPFWSEPPSTISPDGEVSRIMEEVSCGSWGFWDWGSNPVGAAPVFRAYRKCLTREKPVVDVALFFPTSSHRLQPQVGYPARLSETGAALRDVMDFDIVDELLVRDGALRNYRVLIWPEGRWVERETMQKIVAWAEQGGVVLGIADCGLDTVEGDVGLLPPTVGDAAPVSVRSAFLRHVRGLPGAVTAPVTPAFMAPRSRVLATAGGKPVAWATPAGRGWGLWWSSYGKTPAEHRAFYEFCRDAVYNLHALDRSKRNAAEVDRAWDGVYCTLLANGEVFVLNDKADKRTVTIGPTRLTLPPHSLRTVMWRR